MFKQVRDLCDVVSLLAFCPVDRSFLLTKDASGEMWIPSSKIEKKSWNFTIHKIVYELFGVDGRQCIPLRVYKVWVPQHTLPNIYHAVYELPVKPDIKKKINKYKGALRTRLHWISEVELERLHAHASLRSPEVAIFAQMALGVRPRDVETEMDHGLIVEVCEDHVITGGGNNSGSGAAGTGPQQQLLHAANYSRDDQIRMYREFLLMVFPALYMSQHVFTQFMIDIGWHINQCPSLFRAADVNCRGGLSFLELLLWLAALEPGTQHGGVPAELRCRYIFRYFDSNRDSKLEYSEFKELIAAARAARQLPTDALSVSRDADVCFRQMGLQPNSSLPVTDFLRGVGELRLRGTSSLLRAPRCIAAYLADLQERERDRTPQYETRSTNREPVGASGAGRAPTLPMVSSISGGIPRAAQRPDYTVAAYTVRLRRRAPTELLELSSFDEEAVSTSTTRLVCGPALSLEVLGPRAAPSEALAAVHYFAASQERPQRRGGVGGGIPTKAPWSWGAGGEEAALGGLLLRLTEAVRPIIAREPRLLRLAAPVYAIGDLHGNLEALMAMETALWPNGAALAPAQLLFLGDYVDRGPHGVELMAYLLAAKLQRPHGVFLVRGNHETRDIQRVFTFHSECIRKYGEAEGGKVWAAINLVFDVLPLAAVVDEKVFCCHGGIPPPWVCPVISAIDKVPTPLSRPAEQSSIAWELLWNDPVNQSKMTASLALELATNEGFAANAKRGTGHTFDQTALDRFLLTNSLSHVVRAHEVHQNGFLCQMRGRLVSVFSSSNYCGGTNDSGVALLEGGKLRLLIVNGDY